MSFPSRTRVVSVEWPQQYADWLRLKLGERSMCWMILIRNRNPRYGTEFGKQSKIGGVVPDKVRLLKQRRD